MASISRLRTALEDGLITLPDDVHLMRPSVDFDFAALPWFDLSHSFAPDVTRFKSAGLKVLEQPRPAKVICVSVPKFKSLARSMVGFAAANADLVLVDGQKTDGIDSLFKDVRKRLGDVASVTKAHGRMFWFSGTDALADWEIGEPAKGAHGYYTTAGVFSDGEIDKGSAILAAALPALKGRIADFGAGWGYLSDAALKHDITSIDLIEAERLALECAKLNVSDERAQFHWADATKFKADQPFDTIIMNPPFHTGRAGDPSLGQDFISNAAKNLTSRGDLWMVANRHLPYEAALDQAFAQTTEIAGSPAFKIFHASRPRR